MVQIVGPAPWRMIVDGEAARYRSGYSMVQPYKHGAVDEPEWVPGRIDSLTLRIHERLKQYAVYGASRAPAATPAATTPSPEPPPASTPTPPPEPPATPGHASAPETSPSPTP